MDEFEDLRSEETEVENEEGKSSTPALIAQFFVIPVVIVLVCVGVFLLFGLISSDQKNAADYLNEIKISKGSRRWQAAFELSKHLEYERVKESDRYFVKELISVYEDSKNDDPKVRRFLVLAMGRLGDKRVVPVLVRSLDDTDSETLIYTIWSLGNIGVSDAVPDLIPLLDNKDTGIRKMTAYTLGVLKNAEAIPALQVALNDSQNDVRWNAALALAQFRDKSGLLTIRQMLDRDYLNSIIDLDHAQKEEVMVNAIRALALIEDESSDSVLVSLSEDDPSLKVRQTAINALSELHKTNKL